MSYEIVKSVKVVNENNEWYAQINSTANNIRPYDYYTWNYGKGKGYDKETLEKHLLLDFFYGNLQKGISKYNKIAQLARNNNCMDKYKKYDRVYYKALHRYYATKNPERKQELSALQTKIDKLKADEAKTQLYNLMKNKPETIKFALKEKFSNRYAKRVNRLTVSMSTTRRVFSDPVLWHKVNTEKWWQENFIIELDK